MGDVKVEKLKDNIYTASIHGNKIYIVIPDIINLTEGTAYYTNNIENAQDYIEKLKNQPIQQNDNNAHIYSNNNNTGNSNIDSHVQRSQDRQRGRSDPIFIRTLNRRSGGKKNRNTKKHRK
jgi:hypothetical protein